MNLLILSARAFYMCAVLAANNVVESARLFWRCSV
jgi:hypothetical protein